MQNNNKYSEENLKDILVKCYDWLLPNIIKDKSGNEVDVNQHNLFVNSFLHENNLTYKELQKYFELYPYFDTMYQNLKEVQQYKLINKGIWKETDVTMTKFYLTNNYDMTEKSETVNHNKHSLSSDLKLKDMLDFDDDED